MAQVTNKVKEITSVTLTLSKDEAEALRLLTSNLSLFIDPVVYGPVARVREALVESGIKNPERAKQFVIDIAVNRRGRQGGSNGASTED